MRNILPRKLSLLLLIIVMFLTTCSSSSATAIKFATVTPQDVSTEVVASVEPAEGTPDTSTKATAELTPTLYLPMVNRTTGKFIGIYLDNYWTEASVNETLPPLDEATGKKHSSVGWFIDLEDTAFTIPVWNLWGNNLYSQLEWLWRAGYISFINLGSNATAGQIINGERDSEIGYAAEFYKAWIDQGEGRRAMIAPLQEMNGVWTAYGANSTPNEYKLAYRHIIDIFTNKGIARDQVWWVFAPNGYNDADKPERMFENYYPGDDVVDIIGFSSYNYGYCPDTAPYWRWESHPEIFEPYIARMETMAPTKPIIIAETASTAYYHDANDQPVIDYDQMSQWLIENYQYFSTRSNVIGIYYFSFEVFDGFNCEIEINPDGQLVSGYGAAVSDSIYKYLNTLDFDYLVKHFR